MAETGMRCGNCRDCKWWHMSPMLDHWLGRGVCELTVYTKVEGLVHPETKALVSGYDDHCLFTAPDFGCVQWEGKGGIAQE